ncbi:MAG TPA: putative zinc-binding protein [Thermoguttaceae bacterium]|nr:putative zinc-binding protein [Thermoguttaceae bacterium]
MADETTKPSCGCCAAPKLIFACSGAADVGQLSDLAARKLTAEGVGKMFCLAGIGGRVSGIMATTEAATAILAIDGCPLDCARKTLEEAGFTRFEHERLSDLGMEKGKTPATPELVDKVVARGRMRLTA